MKAVQFPCVKERKKERKKGRQKGRSNRCINWKTPNSMTIKKKEKTGMSKL
jgi:hypothetical protein